MTDFYAYFELTGTVTARVGGVSKRDARERMPDKWGLLGRVMVPYDPHLQVRDLEVELVGVMPSWEAEEFARHAFLDDANTRPPKPCAPKKARPSGIQYMWNVDTRLYARCGFVITAPTRALAQSRTEEAMAVVRERGFTAIDLDDVRFAKAEPLEVRAWAPEHLYARAQEVQA